MRLRLDKGSAKTFGAVLLLSALCLLAFGGAGACGFVDFDDDLYVFGNPQVRGGLSWPNVRWAFTTGHAGNWHPLTWLSLMADTEWCAGSARGYHATNLALHALNAVLLFLALRQWTGRPGWALIVSALWAVHPLRTESVAWISQRKDVLAAFFGLLALAAYGGATTGSAGAAPFGSGRIPAVTLFYALSLLAKPAWVTLPFLLLLLDCWPLRRWPGTAARRLMAEKWPLFLLAAVSSAVVYGVQQTGGAVRTSAGYPLGARLANAAVGYMRYLRALFWPVDLAAFYPHPGAGVAAGPVAGSIAILLGIGLLTAALARRQPWWLVGWLWFLGALVPMIGLVQVGGAAWADRYSYLPHIGLIAALVWGAGEIADAPARRPHLFALATVLAIGLALLSRRQTEVWRNSETLFTHAIAATEDNALAHGALGYAYAREGRNAEAIGQLKRALEIQPDNLRALNNLAWIWATDPAATPRQVETAAEMARRAAEQVRQAKAEGVALEPGVEQAVMDTLEKAEERRVIPNRRD